MKKTLFVMALAVALVLVFSASALAVGPFAFNGAYSNANYPGYLSWGYAVAQDAVNNVGSPHGNYTTATNKCAVCHSVHQAAAGASVLTPVPGNLNTGGASTTGYTKGCAFCHATGGSGFSVKSVTMGLDGTISPHSNCSRCHIASPHGVGASDYPVLAAALINTNADDQILADLTAGANGLTADMFDATPASWDQGRALGTGYLCNDCHTHGAGTNELAFAVNTINAQPLFGAAEANNVTGHRVWADDTTTWNRGAVGSQNYFSAYFTGGGAAGATSQVAFADALGCKKCHDATTASGSSAFPHGYVDAAGAYVTKTTAGAAQIWLTTAGDVDDAHVVAGAPATGTTAKGATTMNLTNDGLCLKCHLNGDKSAGVGVTF